MYMAALPSMSESLHSFIHALTHLHTYTHSAAPRMMAHNLAQPPPYMDDDYSSTTSSSSSQLKQPLSYRVADKIVGGLFSVEPIFNVLSKKAR